MTFRPSTRLGFGIGFSLIVLLVGAIALGTYRLSVAEMSPFLLVWILIPLLAVPLLILVIYRLYGLLSARYLLDRDGFYLQWGMAREQVPIANIKEISPGEAIETDLSPPPGFWWPGCIVAQKEIDGLGSVDIFATTGKEGTLLLRSSGDKHWVISPADRIGFIQHFTDSTRLGSLESISAMSERPDFYVSRIWEDRIARVLIIIGLVVSLALIGYLGVLAGTLPNQVPFGFDPLGQPSPIVPTGRLLLLPLIGALCWVVDLVLGAWIYRNMEDRVLAYIVWAAAVLVGGILWGALYALLSAPQSL